MPPAIWFLIVALAVNVAAPGPSASAPAPVAIPDTPAGRRARAVLESLTRDHAARETLVRESFSDRALENMPADAWAALLDRIAAQSGGLDPVALSLDSSDDFLVMDVRARRGYRFARFYLAVARSDPGKIADLGIFRIRDPAKAAADAWPTGRVAPAAIVEAIDVRARRLAEEDLLSGVVLVARQGTPVYSKAFGEAEKSFRIRNATDTRFHLASAGKMFTAVAIGQLADAGKLALDDTLARWLPEFPNRDAARRMTVRHLLTHTSGLGDIFGPDYARDRARYVRSADYFPLIAKEPPAFEAGARFRYSNGGYVLLGAIVERASGMPYEDYLRRHVFEPAGMTGAGVFALDAVVPNRATGYASRADDPLGLEPRQSNIMMIGYLGNGAGGSYASAPDMLAFSRALLGHRLLSPATTALFTAPKVDFAGSPRPQKYGYGFSVLECGGRTVVGHGGGGPNSGVSSTFLAFADGSWTIVVLTNYDPPTGDDFAHGLCEFLARQ